MNLSPQSDGEIVEARPSGRLQPSQDVGDAALAGTRLTVEEGEPSLAVLQGAFTAINMVGIYRWLLA
jgi:hypothetical protein